MFGPDRRCVVVVGAQWGDEGKGKLVDVMLGVQSKSTLREKIDALLAN